MKVNSKIGSTERFKEMFQKINKVKLNEEYGHTLDNRQMEELATDKYTCDGLNHSEIEMDEDAINTIDSINSPIDSLPKEKKDIILKAIDNITYKRGRREYKPTAAEINDEILKMQNKSEVTEEITTEPDFETHDVTAVHLWDGIKGAKVAIFYKRPNGTGGYSWKPSEQYPTIIMAYNELEKPEIAFLKGDAAMNFLAKEGYEFNTYNKTINPISSSDDDSELKENDELDMSGENTDEPVHDMISGGIGDNTDKKFSVEQIRKGLSVEKEHSDDPMIALDIVFDHLTEDEFYYGDKTQDPEQMAQCGAMKDANHDTENDNFDDDKEEENLLLGFKSMNVGDVSDDDEISIAIDEYINSKRFR
jgi:hypothetical protein